MQHYTARTWFDRQRLERVWGRFVLRCRDDRPELIAKTAQILQGIYLLRVPIITLLLLWALPIFALGKGRSYLGNLFIDLEGMDLLFVTVVALLASFSAVAAINAILVNGHERFGIPLGKFYGGPFHLLAFLAPYPTISAILRNSAHQHTGGGLLWVGLGIFMALVVTFWIRRVQNVGWERKLEEDPDWETRNLIYPFPLTSEDWSLWEKVAAHITDSRPNRGDRVRLTPLWDLFSFLARLLGASLVGKRLYRAAPKSSCPSPPRTGPISHLKSTMPLPGYVYRPGGSPRGPGPFYSAHTYLALLTLVLLVVWAALFLWPIVVASSTPPPPLVFLVVSLWIVCLLLAALAFFVDVTRTPVLTTLGIWAFVFSYSFSDYHYETFVSKPSSSVEAGLSPESILWARRDRPVVLVAAAGGGIQAAAWTTKVLSELAEIEEFRDGVTLLSGVSGGAVGVYHFADQYPVAEPRDCVDSADKGTPTLPKQRFEGAYERAKESSLADVGWGLVGLDLPQFVTGLGGLFKLYDRGWALERAFAKRSCRPDARLHHWESDVAGGARPAVLFGATVSQTGEPIVFGTTRVSGASAAESDFIDFRKLRVREEHETVCCADVALATAVRLSATFPYVSPVARSNRTGDRGLSGYIADGGYYDASGVSALIAWLDEGLAGAQKSWEQESDCIAGAAASPATECESPRPTATDRKPLRIMILRIHPFPRHPSELPTSPSEGARPVSGGSKDPGDPKMLQIGAPLVALEAVRTTGQRHNIEQLLELAKRDWMSRLGAGGVLGEIRIVDAAYASSPHEDDTPTSKPPLSWALTRAQIGEIDRSWGTQCQEIVRNVRAFLGDAASEAAVCEKRPDAARTDAAPRAAS